MAEKVEEYLAGDGMRLQYRQWGDASRAEALVYLHGIESHSEWFRECASEIESMDIAVYAPDRRGSGLNQKERGHCRDFLQLVDDVIRLVSLVKQSHRGVHLAALSWGGKLAAALDMLHPETFHTMTLVSPGFFPRVMPGIGERVAIAADAFLRPRAMHPIPIKDDMFTSVPEYLEYIAGDPLRLRKVTARFYLASALLDRFLKRNGYQWTAPTRLLLAERDAIIDTARVRTMFDSLNAGPKSVRAYEGCRHSLQFERPGEVARDIVDWMKKPLADPTPL